MTDQKVYPQKQPPPPYDEHQPEQIPVVVTTQPYASPSTVTQFRELPVAVKCIHCQADVVTSTEFETGMVTWIACGIIMLAGLVCPLAWLGFCFIPFCIKSLKDVIHTCPNCKQVIGRYNRLS